MTNSRDTPDDGPPSLVSLLRCGICTNVWTAVYPEDAPEDCMECPSCGACDSIVTERWGPDEQRIVIEVSDEIIFYRDEE